MGIVCPSCDVEPAVDATAGGPCPACGARLVIVDTGDNLVGSIIDGRFEVLGRLGSGGMGVVYRARQRSIDREVALKVLDRRVEQDVSSVKRFFREAKLASTLAHPNTVSVIDFGQSEDGRLYLAMELVRGHNLFEELAENGALSTARVVAIGIQLCDALEVAHSLSIVHRDLKLENVMLVDGGRDHVKVLDFGLALSLTDPNGRATATGLISGTPRYMAPEVVLEGAAPVPAQDMYAIGVILAELAIGKALWSAPTLTALFTQKLDVDEAIENVPASLRALVRSLLDPQPTLRPTAEQVRATLRRFDPSTASGPSTIELDLEPEPADPRGLLGHAPTADIAFPDKISLVGLDERDGSGAPAIPPRAAGPGPSPVSPPIELDLVGATPIPTPVRATPLKLRFDPPSIQLAPIALEPKAPKPPPPPAPRKPRQLGPWIALLLIAMAAGGIVLFLKMKPRTSNQPARSGIEIKIVANHVVDVEIDGRKAGKTPMTLNLAKSTKLIMISGGGTLRQIAPDHDQTVELGTE